jgi:hypothetical protein
MPVRAAAVAAVPPARPGDRMAGRITLQSSREPFDESFIARLPAVEKAMLAQGLDPGAFVFAKNDAAVSRLPITYRPDGHPVDYTVTVRGRSFTVTQPNDLAFLHYFYDLCLRRPAKEEPHLYAHTAEKKVEAFISRLERWLNEPI